MPWKCPTCKRTFKQTNQRHTCGTGNRKDVLRNRPEHVVRVYDSIETFVRSLGPIEIVARERYVLFRSHRIFADLVIMTDAVRVAVHLGRRVDDPMFFKVATDRKKVTHVAKITTAKDVGAIKRYLQEAYDVSVESSK